MAVLLTGIMGAGFLAYLYQFQNGLGVTGLSRDVSWGLYIGQFTFLVGVAASAVMLVIPYYLHDYKKFGKIVILGEFLAISCSYNVHPVHLCGYGAADENHECCAASDPKLGYVLGFCCFERLSFP